MKCSYQSLAVSALALLLGCSTPYQQCGYEGGYRFNQVSENEFKVGFWGNGFTSAKKAYDYALLRAAEVTQEYGFTHFAVNGQDDASSIDSVSMPSTSQTYGTASTYGDTTYYSGTTTTYKNDVAVYKPGVVLIIKCYKDATSGVGRLYDAVALQKEIKAKYGIR
jgi:hypothetical protein